MTTIQNSKLMSIGAEQQVLGSALRWETAAPQIIKVLTADSFTNPAHRTIFAVIAELAARGIPTQSSVVGEELKKRRKLKEIGGAPYLNCLYEKSCLEASLGYYLNILREKEGNRILYHYGKFVQGTIADEQPQSEKIAALRAGIDSIAAGQKRDTISRLSAVLPEAHSLLIGEKKGLPTGYIALDYLLNGLPIGLTVIGARPSMGKTALAVCMALRMAKKGKRIAFFTLETTPAKLAQRLICAEAKVDGMKPKRGEIGAIDKAKIEEAQKRLKGLGIYFIDSYRLNSAGVSNIIKMLKPDCAIIDYIQLMKPVKANSKHTRNDEVSSISRDLKIAACEAGIPFVVLSQLSRSVEYRSNPRPRMADLRDSGSIEQDADAILLLYREDQARRSEENYVLSGTAEISVVKNKDGPTGVIELQFITEYASFTEGIKNG